MSNITKQTYEDPYFVRFYAKHNNTVKRMKGLHSYFMKILEGKSIIDIGCGPGYSAQIFAENNFKVLGIDFSSEMIKTAKNLSQNKQNPTFLQMDMMKIDSLNKKFDGIWICASMLHLKESESEKFLTKLKKILKPNSKIYIGVKEGKQGTRVVTEKHQNQDHDREFTFWTKENLEKLFKKLDYKTIKFNRNITERATWLNYFLELTS